jgi:ATP-binding cassette, subfamily A (ABC1), member 3
VALTWKFRIFAETNTGLILVVHLLLGLVLASWSFFVTVPFGKSPHLAAVASTFLGLVFAVLALVIQSSQTGVLFIFSILFPPSFYVFALKAICSYESHQFPTDVLKADPDMGIVVLPLLIAAIVSQNFLMTTYQPGLKCCLDRRLPVALPRSSLGESLV